VGYFPGYWSGRLLKLDEATCRTLSLEVGMQNAGLASGIALQVVPLVLQVRFQPDFTW
jgi:BASS family bile acid:Na+ symporter